MTYDHVIMSSSTYHCAYVSRYWKCVTGRGMDEDTKGEEKTKIKALFDMLDVDSSGTLSHVEVLTYAFPVINLSPPPPLRC